MLNGKLKTIILAAALVSFTAQSFAQTQPQNNTYRTENYGNTLNLGLGIAYFSYLDADVPFFSANYEFDVARNFTLAPFIGIASYQSNDYYNGYYYHETYIPIGVKGTYYFDELLDLNPKWDLYLAASLGFGFHKVTWQDGYTGDEGVAHTASDLYLDAHIGAEYHINRRLGLFLDLSTGVSTVGLAIHGHSTYRRTVRHDQ